MMMLYSTRDTHSIDVVGLHTTSTLPFCLTSRITTDFQNFGLSIILIFARFLDSLKIIDKCALTHSTNYQIDSAAAGPAQALLQKFELKNEHFRPCHFHQRNNIKRKH